MDPSHIAADRMSRTGLTAPIASKPVDVVRHHLAMQSQDFGPAKWSIGQRLTEIEDPAVHRAVSTGQILRTHVLRETWHFVARSDLGWLMALSGPRVEGALLPRYKRLELDARTLARSEKLIERALEGGEHLTRKELAGVLKGARLNVDGQRLPHILIHCEVTALVCSGAVKGKEQTYGLFADRVPQGKRFDRDAAVVELVKRYLGSHGPATLKDMSWWSGLTMSDLRAGLEGAGADSAELDGLKLWWLGDGPRSHASKIGVHLLQSYDELVVGYTESRYIGDPRAAKVKANFSARDRPTGVVLVGARVVGHWRRSIGSKTVDVEVLLYQQLRGAHRAALEKAVDRLGAFLDKETSLTVSRI